VTIQLSTTDKRDGRALALFARWQDWQQGKTREGRSFFAIPGSEPGLFHMADQNDCSCPDRQHGRNVCKHMRAVRFWMAAYATGAVASKPRPSSDPADDRVILTAEGAAFLAAQREQSDPTPTAEAVAVVDLADLADLTDLADPFEAGELVDPAPERTVPDPDELREHIARLVREQDTYRRGLLAVGTRPVDDDLWCKRDEQIRRLQAKLPPATLLPPCPSRAVAARA
jgi:hypothetical protein